MVESAGRDRVGRARELTALTAAATAVEPPSLVAFVHGPGGIGKSHLVRRPLRHLPAPVRGIYLDARDVEPTPAGLRRALGRALGFPEPARRRAARARVDGRVAFEIASATTFTGIGFDLVFAFNRLQALGDPVAVARHARAAIAPRGCWMLVEPTAVDDRNPVGRMWGLDRQARLRAITEVTREAGFTRCERAAGTTFADVYAIRP